MSTIAYHGYDPRSQQPAAAVIPTMLPPEERDRVYSRLAPGARHHPILARRWKVWAVLCTEDWAITHANHSAPPKRKRANPPGQ